MDLTSFTKPKKKINEKEEIIVDNNDVTIKKIGEKVKFKFKTKKGIKKYQDYIFLSPTNCEIIEDDKKAEEFFRKSLEDGVEGLMFKSTNASYQPGLRVGSMAKLKETKEDIDVVIIGAEHGKGKRAGYYSSFLVAVKNDDEHCEEEDRFLPVGKVSSGIKELSGEGATMENITNLLKPLKTHEDKEMTFFEPKVVIEVRYQEIQKSTTYKSGYALRFPRIINLREDKALDEINSINDIERFI